MLKDKISGSFVSLPVIVTAVGLSASSVLQGIHSVISLLVKTSVDCGHRDIQISCVSDGVVPPS